MRSRAVKRWVLFALTVVCVLCLLFLGGKPRSLASAGLDLQAGGDGRILVVPVQIARDSFGLAMVDTVGQTLWIYELSGRGPAHRRLRLLAARSWRYDRLLQEFNTDRPGVEEVKMLLESFGQKLKEQNKGRLQDGGLGILEIAEPNSGDLGR